MLVIHLFLIPSFTSLINFTTYLRYMSTIPIKNLANIDQAIELGLKKEEFIEICNILGRPPILLS